jgi:hypothetical protein
LWSKSQFYKIVKILKHCPLYSKIEKNLFGVIISHVFSMCLWPHVQYFCWCYYRAGVACTVHLGSNILHSIALLVAAESGRGTNGHRVWLLSLSWPEAIIAIFSEVDRLKNTMEFMMYCCHLLDRTVLQCNILGCYAGPEIFFKSTKRDISNGH